MKDLAAAMAGLLGQVSAWEALAVALGIAYLLLAMRESLWCWYAAFASTLIYLFLFWDVGLLMESTLQIYYLAMAVYGWWHWRSGRAGPDAQLPITIWSPGRHVAAVAGVVSASLVSGYLLSEYTGARLPYLDSFTTWGSILTTWMVARKILENWIYWMVIDSVSLYLYLDRGLFLTAMLFATYLVIVVFGFIQWHRHYREQHAATPAAAAG
jgi:nicotinamide mononucleotide transporter